jgi:hypothetical protein
MMRKHGRDGRGITQAKPPFAVTQSAVLVLFVAYTMLDVVLFRTVRRALSSCPYGSLSN